MSTTHISRALLVDHVSPLFRANPGSPQVTWTEKFGREITAIDSPAFFEMTGVQDAIDIIFYHGYDCGTGQREGWTCEGLTTTCPRLDAASKMMKHFYDAYGKNRLLWMTGKLWFKCNSNHFDIVLK